MKAKITVNDCTYDFTKPYFKGMMDYQRAVPYYCNPHKAGSKQAED